MARTRRRRHVEEPHDNLERWVVSYADFITLLFAFFTTLYAISVVDVKKAESLEDAIRESFSERSRSGESLLEGSKLISVPSDGSAPQEDTRLELLGERVRELSREAQLDAGLRVRETEDGLVISLADSLFFSGGGAGIPDGARGPLDELARLLGEIPHHLRIEGHTDDQPIATREMPSNWHLSATRAVAIVQYLERAGLPSYRLSASGFAAERPLVSNGTPEGRAINRRVDVVVLRSRLSRAER